MIAYNYVANFHDGSRHRNLRQSGRVSGRRRSCVSAESLLGSTAGRDRLLQQLHDQLSRQPVRDRRRHAQRRVMRNLMINSASHAFCNQPIDRRADLLDPEHRVPPARRVDAVDRWIGRRALLQQHDPVGDGGTGCLQRPLAQQPDPGRELGAGDLQRQHLYQLLVLRLQRLQAESRCHRLVPVELAAVRGGGRLHRGHRWAPSRRGACRQRRSGGSGCRPEAASRDQVGGGEAARRHAGSRRGVSPRWWNTAPRRSRISTACWSITTSSSRCRGSMRRTAPVSRRSTRARTSTLRCVTGSAALDRGTKLPTVTDGFAGSAPDLGALERGQAPPQYGPRPLK